MGVAVPRAPLCNLGSGHPQLQSQKPVYQKIEGEPPTPPPPPPPPPPHPPPPPPPPLNCNIYCFKNDKT